MSDEAITILGRVILLPIFLSYIALAVYRIKTSWNHSKRLVILLITCSVLLIISTLTGIPKPVTFYTDFFHMMTMLYSMFFAYIVSRHLWEKKSFINISNDPFLLLTTIIVAYVGYGDLHRSNFGVITDNDPVDMNIYYTVPHLASYMLMTVFSVVSMYHLYRSALADRSLEYRVRAFATSIAFLIIAICCSSVVINIYLAHLGEFSHRTALNIIYHYGKLIYFPVIFLAIMLPRRVVDYLIGPLHQMQVNRKRIERDWIKYLHEKITSIVPSVKLEYGDINIDDMVVEIADARMIIWTHVQHEGLTSLSPQSEASIIRDFLDKKVVFQGPGVYPPAPAPKDERLYNLHVAKQLKNLVSFQI